MAKKVNFTFCELGGSFVCCFKATMCYTGAPVLYILKHLIQNVNFYFYKLIFIQAFIKYLCVHKHGLVSLCLFVCLTLKMILCSLNFRKKLLVDVKLTWMSHFWCF